MGWEFRIFFRPTEHRFTLVPAHMYREARTDKYVLYTPDNGTKARAGRTTQLEEKLRIKSDGWIDKWQKTLVSPKLVH